MTNTPKRPNPPYPATEPDAQLPHTADAHGRTHPYDSETTQSDSPASPAYPTVATPDQPQPYPPPAVTSQPAYPLKGTPHPSHVHPAVIDAEVKVKDAEAAVVRAKAEHETVKRQIENPAPPFLSDDGISVTHGDGDHIVNLTDPKDAVRGYDARRFEIHLGGKTYSHVAENNLGQWLYRYSK